MVRYLITAASALAMMTGVALAQDGTTKIITKSSPDGASHSRTIIRHHVNRFGHMVTTKKTYREGIAGSSVSRTRTKTDPMTGVTTKSRTVEHE